MRRATGPPMEPIPTDQVLTCGFQPFLYQAATPTLFLDADLNILFFTPSLQRLLNVLTSDIGRPLADLSALGLGEDVIAQARHVLEHGDVLEGDIISRDQRSYRRQISPYIATDLANPGLVMTFADQTEIKQLTNDLDCTREDVKASQADHLNVLAVLSHDLRQPLQTLKLLQALLTDTLNDAPARQLAARIGDTLSVMSAMITLLLDTTPKGTGTVTAHRVDFQVETLFLEMRSELKQLVSRQGLTLRIVPCRLTIRSNPHLLKQMLRVLLCTALTHTNQGRLLLGCRRHGNWLSLEIRTGGACEIDGVQNPDLSNVQRLGAMLGHQLKVHSAPGAGTLYSINIALSPSVTTMSELMIDSLPPSHEPTPNHRGMILIVEDDAALLKLLGVLLHHEGYEVAMALDGTAALSWILHSGVKPDLVLADYHLGNGMNGLQLIGILRNQWHPNVPAIILTGDVSPQTAIDVAAAHCTQLNKPTKLKELIHVVHTLFADTQNEHLPAGKCPPCASIVYVVDGDDVLRCTVRQILEAEDYLVFDFATCEAFLLAYVHQERACLLLDARLPGMSGIDMLRELRLQGDLLPTIIISGSGDIRVAVDAMKAGAWDFIEKPFDRNEMLDSVQRALGRSQDTHKTLASRQEAIDYIATLTARQRQIMDLVLAGHPSKNIAVDLGISQRTVENHRASIMTRTHSSSIPALARLAQAAVLQDVEDDSPGP